MHTILKYTNLHWTYQATQFYLWSWLEALSDLQQYSAQMFPKLTFMAKGRQSIMLLADGIAF